MKKTLIVLGICLSTTFFSIAQENQKIIKHFGPTFNVENPDVKTDINANHKIIFDVMQSSEDKSVVNKYIETAARFLNMHAKAGLKPEQLHVAMTIHGGAWQDVMTNEAYKEKFGVDNPNFELINQLSEAGVDIAFVPDAECAAQEIFPPDHGVYVTTSAGSQPGEGGERPEFFRGVATVVTKLFNMVQPDMSFFGQKDGQQCAVIEELVSGLNFPIEIVRVPTVRDVDGLARSSRNDYLTQEERRAAPALYAALQNTEKHARDKVSAKSVVTSSELRSIFEETLTEQDTASEQLRPKYFTISATSGANAFNAAWFETIFG